MYSMYSISISNFLYLLFKYRFISFRFHACQVFQIQFQLLDFVQRSSIKVAILANQGFSLSRLHHAFKKCYGRHQDLIGICDESMSAIAKCLMGMFIVARSTLVAGSICVHGYSNILPYSIIQMVCSMPRVLS